MRLKEYQLDTLDTLDKFVERLVAARSDLTGTIAALANVPEPTRSELVSKLDDPAVAAWNKARADGVAISPADWRPLADGHGEQVPHVCLQLPTGSGKTLIAGHAVGRVLSGLDKAMTGFVLWIVPSEAIYKQTRRALRDRGHPLRQALEVASGGRVKLLEKGDDFTAADVANELPVMLLMLQSARQPKATSEQKALKVFRESGNYASFFPDADDAIAMGKLRAAVPNLESYDLGGGGVAGAVIQSLGNTLRIVRPLVVLDEGHTAYSIDRRKLLGTFNPRFLLELTATPSAEHSNILVKVGGKRLRDAEMIKLPIELIADHKAQWKDTLKAALDKRAELETRARENHARGGAFIRPIMLVRVERTGKDQRDGVHIHTEDVVAALNDMGVPTGEWVRRQTASVKELDGELMSDTSQVRVIVTKDALREGWDCPFAYVLALLSKTQARNALTQMIGRVLRQPFAKRTEVDDLNSAWVYCADLAVKDAVESIRKGLEQEGMGDLKYSIKGAGAPAETKRIERRDVYKGERILIPRVTHVDGKGGCRELDFDLDILSEVQFDALTYDKAATLTLDDLGAQRRAARFDYSDEGAIERVGAVVRETLGNSIDKPDLARRLLGLIPNPWIGYKLVDEAVATLKERGIDEAEIAKGRLDLLDSMRVELAAKADTAARAIFERKLKTGVIAFRLTGAKADWEMPPWDEVEFRPLSDTWETDADGELLQRTLFERIKHGELNGFERDVALYLDGSNAIAWWWRLTSRGAWGLQGWRRHKVYPDFLMRLSGDGRRMVVLETKGKQLDNEDTAFKRELMEALGATYQKPSPGEEELFDDSPDAIRFRMLMQEENWKTELSTELT
ncbi:DEAD/DEAH box helicase [Enterovirga sp. GCM10030262]|uniref:DEAD/DEAH box helicase n=1 Tax=Enterovirga sp. GCM10030262 TaxID=3273391 RepID=UPI0036075368